MNNLRVKERRVEDAGFASYADIASSVSVNFCHVNREAANDKKEDHLLMNDSDERHLSEFERARQTSKTWSMGQD